MSLQSTNSRPFWGPVKSPAVRWNSEIFHRCTRAHIDSRLLLRKRSKSVQDKWPKVPALCWWQKARFGIGSYMGRFSREFLMWVTGGGEWTSGSVDSWHRIWTTSSATAEIPRDASPWNGHSMSLKVIRYCANRRGIYDFVLALNSNLTSIFNRSWDSLHTHALPLFQVELEKDGY